MSKDTPFAPSATLLPVPRPGASPAGLRSLVSRDVPEGAAATIAGRHGAEVIPAAGGAHREGPRFERGRVARMPDLEVPAPGVAVPWDFKINLEIPAYIFEQIREYAHREKQTMTCTLLRALGQMRDAEGREVFYVRQEDQVPDRRKPRGGKRR